MLSLLPKFYLRRHTDGPFLHINMKQRVLEQPEVCSSCRSRVLQTGPCPSQHWLSFAGSEWDSRPGEMWILALIWFSWLAGCVVLSCYKPWNSQELLWHHLSLLSGWKHDCIFFMTSVNTWVPCLHLLHSDIYSNAEEQDVSQLAIYGPMKSCAWHSCVFRLFSSFSALCENYISWMSGC